MDSEDDDANLILTANRRQEILENLRKEREQRKELISRGENLRISNLDLTPSNRTSLDQESDPIAHVKAVLQAQVMEERGLKTPTNRKGGETDHYRVTSGLMGKKPPVVNRKPTDFLRSKPSLDFSQPKTDRDRSNSATPPRYSHRSRESDVEATRKEVEKDWTFRPSIQTLPTDIKPRKSWDEPPEARIDRLSRPKTDVIKEREKEKESMEKKALETCTFQPLITQFDSRRVEDAEPVGKRLYEEAERRVREKETLAAKHEEAELANYTFHPRTHSVSKSSIPIYKRLDEVSRKRQDQLARLKQEIEAAETDLTFHPKLNSGSLLLGEARMHSLNVSSVSIAEKLSAEAAKSEQKRAKLAIEVEAQERDQCTFAPKTRPGKRPISASFEARQSEFLERKHLERTPPPKSEAECTFHPHVLPASERILQAAKLDRSQRIQELSSRDARKHAAAQHRAEQEFVDVHTFEPKIDPVSQRLGRSSSLAELAYNENKKAEKRLQLAAEETAFSFHPSLCSTGHRTPAQSDYSQAADISFNITQKHSERQEKFTQYRKLKELDELRECTFTPKTTSNTPGKSSVVIHGLDQFFQQRDRAKKLVAEQQAREAKVFHTETYKKQPTSLVTTPKPFHLHPSTKEAHLAELREDALRKEMQECRFAPRTHTSYVLFRKLKSEIRSLLALMGE